jgi:hypothetical protein
MAATPLPGSAMWEAETQEGKVLNRHPININSLVVWKTMVRATCPQQHIRGTNLTALRQPL